MDSPWSSRLFGLSGWWLRGCLVALIAASGCGQDDAASNGPGADDASLRDRNGDATGPSPDTVSSDTDMSPDDSGPQADSAAEDSPGTDTTDTGGGDPLGPDNLLVGCMVHADCPADGADPGLCCTEALRFESYCGTESSCSGGQRDACLTDAQCSARGPGQWTVCCHDRANYHYCAPVAETCQPVIPCEESSDCVDSPSEPCCTYHEYYGFDTCANAFFANNPDRECLTL